MNINLLGVVADLTLGGLGLTMAPEWRRMYSFSPYFSRSLLFFPGMISYRFLLTWEVGTAHFFARAHFLRNLQV